jgi:uncharacterized OB-fold protein
MTTPAAKPSNGGSSGRPAARFDLPTIDEGTEPWWTAAREGRLLIKRCGDCGKAHFYPRIFCPFCWSENVAWEEASGRATLYTWSVVYSNDLPPFPDKVPYAAAIVDLEEGPRMMTRVVGAEFDALRVGMPLEVTFEQETDEITLPVFTPA